MPTRILIADDDKDFVEGLSWYLEGAGFDVVMATDGNQALEIFRTSEPEVVILDIMMPGTDGVRVCEAVRRESDACIICLPKRYHLTLRPTRAVAICLVPLITGAWASTMSRPYLRDRNSSLSSPLSV